MFMQHFICQREEFETARDSILVWLTEMDLQLTNIEHFSECDVQAKIKQLKVRRPCGFNTVKMKVQASVVGWDDTVTCVFSGVPAGDLSEHREN